VNDGPVARPGRGLALLLASVGLAAAVEAWRSMPLGAADDPGPGGLPLVLGLAVAGLGVATALTRTWPAAAPVERGRGLAVAAAVVGWALALPWLGFEVASIVALGVLARAVGRVPVTRALLFALLTGGGAVLLFRVLLGMPLPRGPWGW
jgi:putative tricarboxylic transport membrane protein